jgi:murein DD-endopeptidase MepM/ murein hydrolase activator NlpD
MAEPAWVLRARRARVHRYRARGTSFFWLQREPALAEWLRRFLPGWLVSPIRRPVLRLLQLVCSRPALQAATAARAMLDGLTVQDLDPWYRRLPQQRAPRLAVSGSASLRVQSASGVPWISIRYASHLVIVGLVALVIYAANASSAAGVLRLATAASGLANPAPRADQVFQWAPLSAPGVRDTALIQPPIRAPQPEFEPAFVATHELAEGETLGELASRYRVSVASLFWSNDLDRGGILAAGQELRIPRVSGVPYVIQPGETLEAIAAKFHVSSQAIILLRANSLGEDMPLPVGQEIFIPGGTAAYPDDILARYGDEQGIAAIAAVSAGVVREAETNLRTGPSRSYPRVGYLDAGYRLKLLARHADWVKVDSGTAGTGWVRADLLGLSGEKFSSLSETDDFPPLPPLWVWPTRGAITSPFGWRSAPFRSFHDGLDIANAAGTRIYAARSGQVIEAGWCSGFGYCVKIDHGEGVVTIYGHMLKKPPVSVGDSVDVGDLIGYMGSTFDRSGGGYSTGVHLHFTVKVNGKAVNPMKFLP